MNIITCEHCGTELHETSSHRWEAALKLERDKFQLALENVNIMLIDIITAEVEDGRRNSYAAAVARSAAKCIARAIGEKT